MLLSSEFGDYVQSLAGWLLIYVRATCFPEDVSKGTTGSS